MKLNSKDHKKLIDFMKRMYPDYTGRKFFLEVTEREFDCYSYWDGGSRTYYKFCTPDGKSFTLPETFPAFQYTKENRNAKLVQGLACVRRSIFMGRESGLTLMLHPSDCPKELSFCNYL